MWCGLQCTRSHAQTHPSIALVWWWARKNHVHHGPFSLDFPLRKHDGKACPYATHGRGVNFLRRYQKYVFIQIHIWALLLATHTLKVPVGLLMFWNLKTVEEGEHTLEIHLVQEAGKSFSSSSSYPAGQPSQLLKFCQEKVVILLRLEDGYFIHFWLRL